MSSKPVPVITPRNRLYWEGTAKGELRLAHCTRCDALFRFAHEWCPECWGLELDWKRASGGGQVSHFSVIHQAPYPSFDDVAPYVLAMIELEEGVRMMSNVIGIDPADVHIGMAVEVAFERRGDFMLPMFKPAIVIG
jgi:uncharacterized OB-fold protein